jgi:hypothetical protein
VRKTYPNQLDLGLTLTGLFTTDTGGFTAHQLYHFQWLTTKMCGHGNAYSGFGVNEPMGVSLAMSRLH